jgi:hypothetical protein
MKMNSLMTGLVVTGAVLGMGMTSAFAHSEHKDSHNSHSCEVSLNYDISVEPKKLVVSQKGEEKYSVVMNKLFVEGKEVELNASQRALLTQYSDELSTQVPQVIDLVNSAVVMASGAVSMALTPLLGDASGAKLDELMAGMQKRIDTVAYRNGDSFFLGATESSLEKAFNEEFEQEIEQLVQNSIGSILMSVGAQMMSAEGGDFQQKMESFGKKMEAIGDDIETQMAAQATDLETKADKLCESFQSLMVLEGRLRAEIPQMAAYPLASSDTGKLRE